MRVLRFYEQEESPALEMSDERVDQIVSELKAMSDLLSGQMEKARSLSSELSNFRSASRTANNQIDDSSLNLDLVAAKIEETMSALDSVVESMEDYKEKGPRYLYG